MTGELILRQPRIAKLLGRVALRQRFQQSGLPDAARALDQSCSEMSSVQKQLVNVLREVAHPDIGVIARVRSANDSLLRSMTTRAQQMDDFLVRLEKQVWTIWLPVVATPHCSSTWIRVGYVVCQRATRNARSIKCRSVTTDTNAGSSCAASRSAAERKASLRRG